MKSIIFETIKPHIHETSLFLGRLVSSLTHTTSSLVGTDTLEYRLLVVALCSFGLVLAAVMAHLLVKTVNFLRRGLQQHLVDRLQRLAWMRVVSHFDYHTCIQPRPYRWRPGGVLVDGNFDPPTLREDSFHPVNGSVRARFATIRLTSEVHISQVRPRSWFLRERGARRLNRIDRISDRYDLPTLRYTVDYHLFNRLQSGLKSGVPSMENLRAAAARAQLDSALDVNVVEETSECVRALATFRTLKDHAFSSRQQYALKGYKSFLEPFTAVYRSGQTVEGFLQLGGHWRRFAISYYGRRDLALVLLVPILYGLSNLATALMTTRSS
jgi:hypothetical protein